MWQIQSQSSHLRGLPACLLWATRGESHHTSTHFIPTSFPSLQTVADLGHDKAGKENGPLLWLILKNVFQSFAVDMPEDVSSLP